MASSANNGNQEMDIDGSSSSVNLNISGGKQEMQNEEANNLLKTQGGALHEKNEEESIEELKALEEKYRRELEEAMKEEKQLRETVEEKEEEVRQWTGFGTYLRQVIQDLRDAVTWLIDRIEELEGRLEEYEENEREEGEGESDDVVQSEGNELGKCRECRERRANVVLLPCMHLCYCVRCNERIEEMTACSICGTVCTAFSIIRLH